MKKLLLILTMAWTSSCFGVLGTDNANRFLTDSLFIVSTDVVFVPKYSHICIIDHSYAFNQCLMSRVDYMGEVIRTIPEEDCVIIVRGFPSDIFDSQAQHAISYSPPFEMSVPLYTHCENVKRLQVLY